MNQAIQRYAARPSHAVTEAMAGAYHRSVASRIFLLAFLARVAAFCVLTIMAGSIHDISRDSAWYHLKGQLKAAQYASGDIGWSGWIDDGWYEIVGVTYWLFGDQLLTILLLNAAFAGAATVLAYKIAAVAFRDQRVAKGVGYLYGLFPSAVYYTSLPLKEALAGLGILAIVWGILGLVLRLNIRGWLWIASGMLIMTALRVYLVPVFAACVILCLIVPRLHGDLIGLVQVVLCGLGLGVITLVLINVSGLEIDTDNELLQYYSVERINQVRTSLNRGNASLYDSDAEAAFSDDPITNIWKLAKGFLFFLFSINPTSVNRARQLAAVPEMLFFLVCLPYLFTGVKHGWRTIPNHIFPILLFGLVIIVVYGSAATNAGAMYRWRLQALPFLIMIILYGASVRKRGPVYAWLNKLKTHPSSWPSWRTEHV